MELIEKRIKKLFPDAAPYEVVLNNYLQRMINEFSLDLNKTITAVSLCPDELNNIVIEKIRSQFGNVFHLGGLTGYPFTGETGFNAFGDHIADNGTAFIFFGPHMGINEHQLGYVNRPGQKRGTLSCGAAFGAYQMLLNNQNKPLSEDVDDYQLARVREFIVPQLPVIDPNNFEIDLLNLLFDKSHDFIVSQSKRIKEKFSAEKIILLGAFVLNTPKEMPDYLQVKYFECL